MNGKYMAAAIAFTLTLVGAGLAQLRPAFGADWSGQDQQMRSSRRSRRRSIRNSFLMR